jgi:pilus assembly protein Flp/PilA
MVPGRYRDAENWSTAGYPESTRDQLSKPVNCHGGEVITAVRNPFATLARLIAAYRDEDGQGLAEYALIIALVALLAIVALMFMGSQVSDKLTIIGNTIASVAP